MYLGLVVHATFSPHLKFMFVLSALMKPNELKCTPPQYASQMALPTHVLTK